MPDPQMKRAKPAQGVGARFGWDTPTAAGAVTLGAFAVLVILNRGFGPIVVAR